MEKVTLNVEKRQRLGKGGARSLRRQGMIPAVIYRAGDSIAVQLSERELSQFVSRTAGEQVIANLSLGGDQKQAIVKDYQVDPVLGHLLHVDFQEILATEEIRVTVHVVTVGEAVGVKRDGGILQFGVREIEVQCLPADITGRVEVDISQLGIGQAVHVRDLSLPEGVRVLTDPEEFIVAVAAVKEEVVAAPEVVAEAAEPEVIKKGKKTAEEEEK
jgi:large subunit ribosomal protein L25